MGTVTASVYTIKREDIAEDTGLDNPVTGNPIYALAGQEKSKGVDLEANANLTDRWQLIAGYAYVDATVSNDTNPNLCRPGASERTQAKRQCMDRYQFNENWGLGLGIKYTAKRYGSAFDKSGDQSKR